MCKHMKYMRKRTMVYSLHIYNYVFLKREIDIDTHPALEGGEDS